MTAIMQFDSVALLEDLPEHNLRRGQVGTVLDIYGEDAFDVTFDLPDGDTLALILLSADQLLVLHNDRPTPTQAVQ